MELGIRMIPVLVDWEDFNVANAIPKDIAGTKFEWDLRNMLYNTLLHFVDTERWDVTRIVAAIE